ncbi:MAG: hypothetical protein AAF388_03945 [Bacteroidota bacterium]
MKTIHFFAFLILWSAFSNAQELSLATQSDSTSNVRGTDMRYNLINKRWVLTEFKSIRQDTVTDYAILLQSCERDNFTQYYEDGTYTIFEGEEKCSESAKEEKGIGKWDLEEENEIMWDEYQGGRETEKQIVELTSTTLKLEFESERGARNILTFYTPEALQTEEIKEKILNPNDYENSLTKMIYQNLVKKNRYVILKKNELLNGASLELGELQKKFKPVIAIYPIQDGTEKNVNDDEMALDSELISKARLTGIDYVVTGKFLQKEASETKNDYKGEVKYYLKILDARLGREVFREEFNSVYPKKGTVFLKNAGKWVAATAVFALGYSYYGLYGAAYMLEAGSNTSDGWDQVFDKDIGDRAEALKKSEVINLALNNSDKRIDKFIERSLPLKIKVSKTLETNKKGEVKKVMINCGTYCNLKPNDKLDIVIVNEVYEGEMVVPVVGEKLGSIFIEEIRDSHTSICKVSTGAKEITKQLETNQQVIYAITTGRKMGLDLRKKR